MLTKLEHYYLVISSLVLAVVTYLLLRRGEQIKDLQQEIILNKLNSQINKLQDVEKGDQNAFNKASQNYSSVRNSFLKLYRDN